MEEGKDEFYYITAMNENYAQPSMSAELAARHHQGLVPLRCTRLDKRPGPLRLIGSGAILREVIAAAALLQSDWNVSCEVWSATSYRELARDAAQVERRNRLNPLDEPVVSHLPQCLAGATPVVAATDYVRAYPQLIAAYLRRGLSALGTDGFGRSDTRASLRLLRGRPLIDRDRSPCIPRQGGLDRARSRGQRHRTLQRQSFSPATLDRLTARVKAQSAWTLRRNLPSRIAIGTGQAGGKRL